jgi:hypothetical protein
MSIVAAVLSALWLAGVAGFGAYGVRAGLGLRLLHPTPLLNLLAWPLALPFWFAVRFVGRI